MSNPSDYTDSPFDNPDSSPPEPEADAVVIAKKYAVVQAFPDDHLGARLEAVVQEANTRVLLRYCQDQEAGRAHQFQTAVTIYQQLGKHANIMPLLEAFTDTSKQYLAHPWPAGELLADWLEYNAHMPAGNAWEEGLTYVTQCLDALGRLHTLGYQHGDITPESILITTDDAGAPLARLLDVGLYVAADSPCNSAKSAMPYRAPEQLVREGQGGITRATDIYAVGAILYTLLYGVPPGSGGGLSGEVAQGNGVPSFKSTGNASLDAELQRIIHRAMAFQPEDRFTSIRTMADALRTAVTTHHVATSTPASEGESVGADALPPLDRYTANTTAPSSESAMAAATATAAPGDAQGGEQHAATPAATGGSGRGGRSTCLILLLALIPLLMMLMVAVAGLLIFQPWNYLWPHSTSEEVLLEEEDWESDTGYGDDYDADYYEDSASSDPEEQERLTPPSPLFMEEDDFEYAAPQTSGEFPDSQDSQDTFDQEPESTAVEEAAPPAPPVPVPVDATPESETTPSAPQVELTPISPPLDPVEPEPEYQEQVAPPTPMASPTAPPPTTRQQQAPPPQTQPRDQVPPREVAPEGQVGEARPPQETSSTDNNFGWGPDEVADDDWVVIHEESRRLD